MENLTQTIICSAAGAIITALVGWFGHLVSTVWVRVSKMVDDVDAAHKKLRSVDDRLIEIEYEVFK